MSRLDPKNREEAYSYQFEDDVKVLKTMSKTSPHEFKKALDVLRTHIVTYLNGTDTIQK